MTASVRTRAASARRHEQTDFADRALQTALCLTIVWGSAAFVLRSGLFANLLYWEGDTLAYYLPVMETYQAALRRWDLPLWTPYIFGGHPLFAEGEGGMLYPFNVLLTGLLPVPRAYVWEMVVRFGLAGTFAFWFARVLGLRHAASLVSGIVFGFGGFTVGQMHHPNVVDSALWLPAVLGCVECACRTGGRSRLIWTVLAGVALGISMLGVHVQPVFMTVALVSAWCLFRAVPMLGGRSRSMPRAGTQFRTALNTLLIAPLSLLIGLGIAAVQWLPLYELSRSAVRGGGLTYASATDFALGPADLVTLLFPFFFQGPANHWWSLWFQWETTPYVGIAALVLGLLGLACVRSRETWWFGAVAAAGLLLALGDSSPLNLFSLLWHTPGLSFIRAPGRFSLLFVLGMAMLSGYGLQWVSSRLRVSSGAADLHGSLRGWHVGLLSIRLLGGTLVFLAAGLLAGLVWLGDWLSQHEAQALRLIESHYLTMAHDVARPVDPALALSGLSRSLDPAHDPTAFGLVLVFGVGSLLLWWSFARQWTRYWQFGFIGLILLDLLSFASGFHQLAPAEALLRTNAVGEFLATQAGQRRVYGGPAPPPGTEPDRLMPLRVADAGGYSSLAPARMLDYLKRVQLSGGPLLNLLHVGYVVASRRGGNLPSYNAVEYQRNPPLISARGPQRSPYMFAASGLRATELRMLGYLQNDRHLRQGTDVARVRVDKTDGTSESLRIRAGLEIADRGVELPLAIPAAHQPVAVAFSEPVRTAEGVASRVLTYFVSLPLDGSAPVSQVALELSLAEGELDILGLALVDRAGAVHQLSPAETGDQIDDMTSGALGRVLFVDGTTQVRENPSVMDRAFLVYAAARTPEGTHTLDAMTAPDFDPARLVYVDTDAAAPDDLPPTPPSGTSVRIVDDSPRLVNVLVGTPQPAILVLADTNYPGWEAAVDGRPAPIIAADYVFRGVHVPAGEHTVEFSFRPHSIVTGALITIATLLVVAGLLAACWIAALRPKLDRAAAADCRSNGRSQHGTL